MTRKRTRVVRTPEAKRAICRAVVGDLRAGVTMADACGKHGVHEAVVRTWLKLYGAEFGWKGSVKDFEPQGRQGAGRVPVGSRPPDANWLAKNQSQLGLALSSGQEAPELPNEGGDTLLSRPEPPASEMEGAIVVSPRRPRRSLEREPREPLYAEPVQREPPPSPPVSSAPLIEGELLRQALREKDAVLTTLEILIREGRIKIPH